MPAPRKALHPNATRALKAAGHALRDARLTRHLSLEEVGQRCGRTRQLVAKAEKYPGQVDAEVLMDILAVYDPMWPDRIVAALNEDPIGDTLRRQAQPSKGRGASEEF